MTSGPSPRTGGEASQALLALADRLSPLNEPLDIAYVAAEFVGRTLGLSRAGIGAVDDQKAALIVTRDWTAPGQVSAGRRFAVEGALTEALHHGGTLTIADVTTDPRAAGQAETFQALDIAALAHLVLMVDGRPSAMLFLHHAQPHQWRDRELAFARAVLDRVHLAIELSRAQAALRERDSTLRLITENVTDYAILTTDPMLRITSWSQGAERTFGYTAQDIVGRPVALLFTPEDREAGAHEKEAASARRDGSAADVRWHQRKDGSRVFVNGIVRPLRDARGADIGFLKIARDETERQRIDDALREGEARLRALTDNLPAGMVYQITMNADGSNRKFVYVSRSCERITGVPAERALQDPGALYDLIEPDYRQELAAAEAQAIGNTASFDVEAPFRRDGELRWARILSAGRRVSDASLVWDGLFIDVTETKRTQETLRQSEARLRFLSELEEALRAANDASAAMLAAAERLALRLEATRCAYADVDVDNDRFVIRNDYVAAGAHSSAGIYSLEQFGPRTAADLHAGRTLVIRDVVEELAPDDGRETFEALGVRAVVCCPLVRHGRLVALMAVHQDRRRDWGDDEISLIEASVDRCWVHIERIAAEARLRESESKFQAIANSIDQMIWSTRADGHHDYYNDRWYEYTGVPHGSTDGEAWNGMFHPDDQERAWEVWRRSLETGEPYHIEYRLRNKSGQYRWVIGRAQCARGEDGNIIRWYGTCTDIHDFKAAQTRLLEESRISETLNRTGAALASELELERLVQFVTDAGVQLTGAAFGAFFHNVVNAAGESYALYTISGVDRSAFEDFPMPRATAVFAPTFRGKSVVRSDDITADPRYGKNAPQLGLPKGHLPVRSYLAVPVTSRAGEVMGGLFLGHPAPGVFQERHENLMVGLAGQAAIAVDNARLYQALRRANETLEERVTARTSELQAAHEALRHSQKMETLGQLTGGVAHDFNNLLQVITGNLEILSRNLPADSPRLRRVADNAMTGAKRAAILTQRLLAFSRRQPLAPKPIDVNRLVASMSELLHRTLGEMIELETSSRSGLWRVEADANQLENAILNVALNARDAMPEGGKLTIETNNTHLDKAYAAQNTEVAAGQYVVICVSDTGVGMDTATVSRAFEPFFTTKEVGKGTGLGLSMVYGFITQSGGHVKISSTPGQGTTVRLYLPRLLGSHSDDVEQAENAAPEGSREETILVCEDDDDVRACSVEVLRELGYRVLEAHDAASALRLLERQDGRIDLLFSDVVLPGPINGAELAREVRRLRPQTKVLFTTGYARDAIIHDGRLHPGVELISKPFAYADLAARVRDVLDTDP